MDGRHCGSFFFTAPEYAKYREHGKIKVPFWLQPEKYYADRLGISARLRIPLRWQGQTGGALFLERPHWETDVWLDDQRLGTNVSLSTPHEYDLTAATPGVHVLTIRVDNRMVIDIGRDSHSVSDHTQGNWNGIVGRVELRATPRSGSMLSKSIDGGQGLRHHSRPDWQRDGPSGRRRRTAVAEIPALDRAGSSSVQPLVDSAGATWQPDGGTFQCNLRVPTRKDVG